MSRHRTFAILFAAALAAMLPAQRKYDGPRPPKKNILYPVHADRLVETEISTAGQQTVKDVTTYVIPGDKSTARTPLAGPMLVIESAGMDVEKLRLFRLEVKNGHREVSGLSGVLGVLFKPGCLQRRVLF